MEDMISRKAAIDAFGLSEKTRKYGGDHSGYDTRMLYEIQDVLEDLPSAQPETHEERTETHACDCISRQAAIDAHYEYCNKHPDAGFPVWSLKILEDLPPADLSEYSDKLWKAAYERGRAEAQRKKGMWIEHNPHKWGLGIVFECSECGEKIDCEPSNFCPNCGADMTEGEG